jgi:hypothetical protein
LIRQQNHQSAFSRWRIARAGWSATSIFDAVMTRDHTGLFKAVLQSDGVDHRRQHAHVIRGDPVHVFGGCGHATEKIPAPNYQAYLDAGFYDFGNLLGKRGDSRGIQAKGCSSG